MCRIDVIRLVVGNLPRPILGRLVDVLAFHV